MLTPQQQKYIAWELTRKRNSSDDEKFTSVLAEAQVDLNPHQIDAALFAFRSPLSKGAILADEVGLGKTIEAALVIAQQWAQRNRRILIIVPATLRKQWSMELAEKFFLPSIIIENKNFKKILASEYRNPFDTKENIVICSYQFAKKQIQHINNVDWDLVVIDEAHKLRNVYKAGNKTANALKDGLKNFKKLLLTATPLQNNIKELYGLISFIDDNYFGSLKSFADRYSKTGLRQDAMYHELRDRISPIIHRTLRSDVQEYVKYTERHAMVQEYYPSDDEIALAELVTEYLQKECSYGMPPSQRSLISLVLHKLLSSSTFAIAGTLKTIIDRLQDILAYEISDTSQDDTILSDIHNDIDDLDDYDEEWLDEEDEEFDSYEEKPKYTKEDIEGIQSEISELTAIYELALGIVHNTKGECLLKALDTAFENKRENNQEEKALIFTESNRTQKYLKQLLEDAGYKDKIVLFNGSNTDPDSKAIYAAWIEKNKGTSRITGSVSADKRQALVDYFRDSAQIMIATEAASEGINLQFCSLVVNYDLPWNPQRVEQRIGRCHRYGQKNDVVVVNFINKANRADQRVYELLALKFNLFCGVFGSSDEVLGSTMDGVDFERRVLDIYQSCRTVEEIDAAFDRLQEDMKDEIDHTINVSQTRLIENFDKDVVSKLKLRKNIDEYRLSEFYHLLWLLTVSIMGNRISQVDNNNYRFLLKNSPVVSGIKCQPGLYQMGKDVNNAYTYRIGHPLAQWVLNKAKNLDTDKPATLVFNYSDQKDKISILDNKIGQSGILRVCLAHYQSPKETEEHLITIAIDETGECMEDDFVSKLMTIPATSTSADIAETTGLLKIEKEKVSALTKEIDLRNREFINEESAKIEHWADDQTSFVEQELKDLKRQIKEKERTFRTESDDNVRFSLQKEILSLQKAQRQKRQELFTVEDEIIQKRDALIDKIGTSLSATMTNETLFTINWIIK